MFCRWQKNTASINASHLALNPLANGIQKTVAINNTRFFPSPTTKNAVEIQR